MQKTYLLPLPPPGGIDVYISLQIDWLEDLINDSTLRNNAVNRANEKGCKMNAEESDLIKDKCFYLRQAYLFSLQHIPDKSWGKCCDMAVKTLEQVGLKRITSGRTVESWNLLFRSHRKFAHPNIRIELNREYSPKLLDSFPEAKQLIEVWANDNIGSLSSERVAQYVRENLIDKLYEVHIQDCIQIRLTPMSIDEMRFIANIDNFSITTAWKYLQCLGFKHCDRRKSYYNDKHESAENVSERKKFCEIYFKMELRTKRWVRLTNEDVEQLENDETDPILPGLGYRVSDTHAEYHIDCHPKLASKEPSYSARMPPNVRPMIICGQDESCYQQNSYPNKCWINSNGGGKLLPKSDGSTIMVSGICSRDFGLGVRLTQDQFDEVNLNRTSADSEFRHYVSETAALEVYGTTEKQLLTSRDCLMQFFDVGINNDGYWGYNHMALQQEDAFDVLRVIYPIVTLPC